MRWHETQMEVRKWFFLTKKRSNDSFIIIMPMFCGVLNRFNPDTNGSFYWVAKIVVHNEKNARGRKKKQLSNSPEFLLTTCSLKAKKTSGNKVDIMCSVWMTESKMLTLQLLLSWIFKDMLLYCQESEKKVRIDFLQYSDIIPLLQKGKEKNKIWYKFLIILQKISRNK